MPSVKIKRGQERFGARFRGKLADNDTIERNIEHILEFDRRYNRAILTQDKTGLENLAAWAEQQNLTIGRRALSAARQM